MRRIGLVLVLLLCVAAASWGWWSFRRSAPPPAIPGVDSVSAGVHSVQLWFAASTGDSLVREVRDVVESATLHERVSVMVAELERGPRQGGVRALPAGTALLRVYLDDRGLMTLDLSRAFTSGFRGGAGAEYLAVGSLLRTLRANLPEVKRVMIVCAGAPIASLGGHLPLDRPLEISDWP